MDYCIFGDKQPNVQFVFYYRYVLKNMRVATAASRFLFTSSFPSNFNNRHFINPSSFIKPLRTTANLNESPQSRRRLGFCDSSPPPVSAATFSPKMSPPPEVEVRESIELNDKEVQIFDRLRDVLRHFRLDTQLRVAGGWVRDKVRSVWCVCDCWLCCSCGLTWLRVEWLNIDESTRELNVVFFSDVIVVIIDSFMRKELKLIDLVCNLMYL